MTNMRRDRAGLLLLVGAWLVASAEACGNSGSRDGVAAPASGDAGAATIWDASSGDSGATPDASGGPGVGSCSAGGTAPLDSGALMAVDSGPSFTGPPTAGTVTVDRGQMMGRLSPGFAGFSFEKTHMTDRFFTGTNDPLIAMFELLGPGIVRIGANDVDVATWVPAAQPLSGGNTSYNVGTADVDALAAFLCATGWKAIYGVSMTTPIAPSEAESVYVANKLGGSLDSIEIGNEINYFANNAMGSPIMQWEPFEAAIHGALPNLPLAGPAAAGPVTDFAVQFANTVRTKIVLLTQHYYKGAASSDPAIADLLTIDPTVATQSQALSAAVQANKISEGFRWGEMNSYSGHGAAGVSDVYASALWSLDFMFTAAEYGSNGVNFHGGGQNMDGNVCSSGAASCTKPFLYSPIDEINSQVTAAAPLFYGMLLVSRAGVGNMFATTATAGALNFTGYSVAQADGSINVILVNKDATNGVNAAVDTGAAVTAADATYLQGPSLDATTGVTFAGAGVTPAGDWVPQPPFALATSGNVVAVLVPPASAVIVHAR